MYQLKEKDNHWIWLLITKLKNIPGKLNLVEGNEGQDFEE
jgi:hypothetical protein